MLLTPLMSPEKTLAVLWCELWISWLYCMNGCSYFCLLRSLLTLSSQKGSVEWSRLLDSKSRDMAAGGNWVYFTVYTSHFKVVWLSVCRYVDLKHFSHAKSHFERPCSLCWEENKNFFFTLLQCHNLTVFSMMSFPYSYTEQCNKHPIPSLAPHGDSEIQCNLGDEE